MKESGGYVYVNNYSGSGTITTKQGYCEFAFHVETGISPFTDITADAPNYEAIKTVFRADLMSGVGNNRFDPESFTSRAMTVQILYVLFGKTPVDSPITWNDIAEDAWYAEAVHWASSKKVASGYSTDTFGPADIITREQLAVMLYRYESTLEEFDSDWDYTIEGFSDTAKIASWADESMRWCVMKGIFTGEDNKLLPKSKLSCRELAQVFANLIKAD